MSKATIAAKSQSTVPSQDSACLRVKVLVVLSLIGGINSRVDDPTTKRMAGNRTRRPSTYTDDAIVCCGRPTAVKRK
jgi:hypothetical protein